MPEEEKKGTPGGEDKLKLEEDEKVVKSALEKFETKREYTGIGKNIVAFLAITASLYHLFYAYFHPFFALDHRSLHLMFMFVLLFALYPLSSKRFTLSCLYYLLCIYYTGQLRVKRNACLLGHFFLIAPPLPGIITLYLRVTALI